jgi:hypothetical protein
MELPLLRLGLLGFGRQDAAKVGVLLRDAVVARCRWELASFEDADLWLLNSPHVTPIAAHGLHIFTPDTPQSPLTIYPQQSSRPVAFTEPLPPTIDAMMSIDLNNIYASANALNMFADTLQAVCLQFALGEQVASRQSGLVESIYHLHFETRLVAIIDLKHWQIAFSPQANCLEMSLASWRHRPLERMNPPMGFDVVSLEKLMWVYASRTLTDRLPDSYTTQLIHLRRLSVLPQSWLHQDHMNVIGLLSQQPLTLAVLQQRTGLPMQRLRACLSALYYTGTLTTDPYQVQRGDPRIHSGYAELVSDSQYDSGGHSTVGQSVFDTHQFETPTARAYV